MEWIPVILILPYLFVLLKIYGGLLKIIPFQVTTSPKELVSVVVACRNEEKNLPELLKHIIEQDYPGKLFEVIIVDDNSTDSTGIIASDYTGKINLISVNNKGTGKKHAIKTGIEASSGNLIITTDADCVMGKGWIRTIAAFYEENKPEMIICPVQLEASRGFFAPFQELEFLSLQGISAGTASSGNGTMCNGANLAFTKEAYLRNIANMHFEIASGDDIFLLHSMKKQNQSKILWLESREAIVTAGSCTTFKSFLKQRKRWISKAKAYNDRETIFLGIVTFVTIFIQVSVLIALLFDRAFLPVFFTIILLKSVPDFLILQNASTRYGRKELLIWFFPAQLVYPLYVFCVALYTFFLPPLRKPNFPSPIET
jgi:glycosyltransferase involved in cell wall biosynthesis